MLQTLEAEIAFKQMKKLIAELPMLTASKENEELIMYLAAAKEAISAVIMTEMGGEQMSVYFVNGSYVAKESVMVQYLEKVKTLASNFNEFSIKQVPRSENKKVDALSKIASTSFAHLSKQVLVEELKEKSINEKEVLAIVEEEGHTWMTPICEYLTKKILPKDKKKARAVRRKASRQTTSLERYTKDPAACTPALDPWSLRLSGQDITS
ncbi:reverse transcriptase domain-containing protein [Tanacetum coccineum]